MNWLWVGIYHGAAMFWETLWALVLRSMSAEYSVLEIAGRMLFQ